MSRLEDKLILQIRALGLPAPEREVRFWPGRKFRFDLCWPSRMLAVEVDGGTQWGRSRHSKGVGYDNDCIKYNEAARLGWRVLRFSSTMIDDGRAISTLEAVLKEEG